MMRMQSMEFNELNVEFGYTYESAAIVPDGSPAPQPVDDDPRLRAVDAAGRAAAARLDRRRGRRPPADQGPGRARALPADRRRGRRGVVRRGRASSPPTPASPLDAVRIGHIDGDLYDPRCMWLRRREIGPDGAVLVRPDRFVAWRSIGASEDPREELADALSQILARPVGVAGRRPRERMEPEVDVAIVGLRAGRPGARGAARPRRPPGGGVRALQRDLPAAARGPHRPRDHAAAAGARPRRPRSPAR